MTAAVRRYARPEALDRISIRGHAVVEASAGTGKTYALEHMVLELLLVARARIDQILAVTFTEKASRELSDRVRSKLEEILLGTWSDAPASVPDARCWRIDEPARRSVEQALFSFDTANISTIHSFCQRVLTDHAFAHRRLFDQVQIAEGEAFADAFRMALREDFARDPNLRPWLELWLRKAQSVDTLEKLLLRCSRVRGATRPQLPEEQLAEAAALLATGLEPRDAQGIPVSLEAVVAQLFLPRVLARARERKELGGEYDFDDMLALVAEGLEGPRGGELAAALRRRYRYALIDEFQDTDDIQWRIFRKIFFESGSGNPLFVIGDPKQAIYAFRGADVETYLAARDEIVGSGGSLVPLTENHRATPRLVEACNTILDQSAKPPFFTGAIRYTDPVAAANSEFALVDGGGKEVAPIHLFCPDSAEKQIRADPLKQILARRIAREIGALLGENAPLRLARGRRSPPVPVRPPDIFVLTRTKEDGYTVGDHLRAARIPHVYFKQEGLFQRDEARDILDLLRAIEDPHDRSRRFHAWLTPFFGLTLLDLESSDDLEGGHPLLQRLFDWKALADARDFSRLFSRILEESGLVLRELFLKENERALTNYLHVFDVLLEEAGRSKGTLADLTRALSAYIREELLPEGFDTNVQRLESEKDAVQIMTIHKAKGLEAAVVFVFGGFSRSQGDAVKTYHENGRRFAYVGSDAPRGIKEAIQREADEEDQRLLYVALTRAKARVYLPYFAPGKAKPFSFHGPYSQLNKSLARLIGSARDPKLSRWFSFEDVPCDEDEPEVVAAAAADLSSWRPPGNLLARRDLSEKFRETRSRHAGFVVASYTGLKAGAGYQAPEDPLEDAADEPVSDLFGIRPPEELPGGRASGVFLHTVLEEIPLESLAAGAPFAQWKADQEVERVFRMALRRYGRDPRHLEHSQRLVHTALTAPVLLPGGGRIEGLCRASRTLREVEFLYPIPENDHPRLSAEIARAPGLERFRIRRGFVRGFVDLVFEHEGLTYFLDWKSDSLPRWDPALLTAHVERNYRLQAKLYGLALVKMLEVHDRSAYEKRFGGFLFCFLRGMRAPGSGVEGIHGERPDWTAIAAWESELLRPDFLPSTAEALG
jgi:exodeoxyribonuclease V beta subunit